MNQEEIYREYWKRKKLLSHKVPAFAKTYWWDTAGFSQSEGLIYEKIKNCGSILDVGAGDLRIKNKFTAAGYSGVYESLDISTEYKHDHADFDTVKRKFGAILCLDVIEHLQLNEGLSMIQKMISLLEDRGILILQTPNGKCIRSPLANDFTHRQIYNLPDLWVYLNAQGISAEGYRVFFSTPGNLWTKIQSFLIGRLLGGDHADNILLIAEKKSTT